MSDLNVYTDSLEKCRICPHNCEVDRVESFVGRCGTDAGFSISSIFNHKGEEPVIGGKNGICNVFFTGCNLKCIYCQNHQISRPNSPKNSIKIDEIINQICSILDKGVNIVGFVSTSHVVPQVRTIIKSLKNIGLSPIFVYNTNAYEKPESIKSLEGLVDIYLPDFKYISPSIALAYSGYADYPYYAALSIKEMYRQKGSSLITNDFGQAESGILVRHLVLPGHVDESIGILKYIAHEISTGIHISLMSQYYPCDKAIGHPQIGRELQYWEYKKVIDEMYSLGFRNGYVQELESNNNYRPNFNGFEPFT